MEEAMRWVRLLLTCSILLAACGPSVYQVSRPMPVEIREPVTFIPSLQSPKGGTVEGQFSTQGRIAPGKATLDFKYETQGTVTASHTNGSRLTLHLGTLNQLGVYGERGSRTVFFSPTALFIDLEAPRDEPIEVDCHGYHALITWLIIHCSRV